MRYNMLFAESSATQFEQIEHIFALTTKEIYNLVKLGTIDVDGKTVEDISQK